jgi:hypothetical protein
MKTVRLAGHPLRRLNGPAPAMKDRAAGRAALARLPALM